MTIVLHKSAPWATERQRRDDFLLRYHRADLNGGQTARYAQAGDRYFKVDRTSWGSRGEDIWTFPDGTVATTYSALADLKFLVSVRNLAEAKRVIAEETAPIEVLNAS